MDFHGALLATQLSFGISATDSATLEKPQVHQETAVVIPFVVAVNRVEAQGFKGLSHEDFRLLNPTAASMWEKASTLSKVVTSSPILRGNNELRKAIHSAAYNKKLYLEAAIKLNQSEQAATLSHSSTTAEDIDNLEKERARLKTEIVRRGRLFFRNTAALELMIKGSKIK